MQRTGGFRKLRWHDERRHKGKRGGLRMIYYWLKQTSQFWMFAIDDKDEMDTLERRSGKTAQTCHRTGTQTTRVEIRGSE